MMRIGSGGYEYTQSEEPTDPLEGESWLDTSYDPPKAKTYVNSGEQSKWIASDLELARQFAAITSEITDILNVEPGSGSTEDYVKQLFKSAIDGTHVSYSDIDSLEFNNDTPFIFSDENRKNNNNAEISPVSPPFRFSTNEKDASTLRSIYSNGFDGITTTTNSTNALAAGSNTIFEYDITNNSISFSKTDPLTLDSNSNYDYEDPSVPKLDIYPRFTARWTHDGYGFIVYNNNDNRLQQVRISEQYTINSETIESVRRIENMSPRGIAFNQDGTKLYTVSDDGNNVYDNNKNQYDYVAQYSLSEPYDLETRIEEGRFYVKNESGKVNSQTKRPTSIEWEPSGKKFYVCFEQGSRVAEYHCSESFDIRTASYPGSLELREFWKESGDSIYSNESLFTATKFADNGFKCYVIDYYQRVVYQFDLDEAYNLETATVSSRFNVNSEMNNPNGIAFNNTGTRVHISDSNGNRIYQYELSEEYELHSATYNGKNYNVGNDGIGGGSIEWVNGGRRLISGNYQLEARTPYEITSLYYNGDEQNKFEGANWDGGIADFTLSDDGRHMFVVTGKTNNNSRFRNVIQLEFSQPYDVSTLNYVEGRQVLDKWYSGGNNSYGMSSANGITMNEDCSSLFILDGNYEPSNNNLFEPRLERFNLEENYDIRSLVKNEYEFTPMRYRHYKDRFRFESIRWSANGNYFYIVDRRDDSLYQFEADKPFDLSTLTESNECIDFTRKPNVRYHDFNGGETILFKNDGSSVYVFGSQDVSEYSIDNYDITNAYHTFGKNLGVLSSNIYDLDLGNSGENLLVSDSAREYIYNITLDEKDNGLSSDYKAIKYLKPYIDNPTHIKWVDSGNSLLVIDNNDAVLQFEPDTPFDINTISYKAHFAPSSNRGRDTSSYNNLDAVKIRNGGKYLDIDGGRYLLQTDYDISNVLQTTGLHSGANSSASYAYQEEFNRDGFGRWAGGIDSPSIAPDKKRLFASISGYGVAAWEMEEELEIGTVNRINGFSHDNTLEELDDVNGISFSKDGRILYVLGSGNNGNIRTFYTYRPYDVRTLRNYGSRLKTREGNSRGGVFNDDGSKFYTTGNDTELHVYETYEPYRIVDARQTWSIDLSSIGNDIRDISWADDGNLLYIADRNEDRIIQVEASTPYEIETIETYAFDARFINKRNTESIIWDDSGERAYVLYGDDSVVQYKVTEPYTTKFSSIETILDLSDNTGNAIQIVWDNDGSELYVVDQGNNNVLRWSLNTPYKLQSASFNTKEFNTQTGDARDTVWSKTGNKLQIAGRNNDRVYQHDIAEPYDLSTQSFTNGNYLSVQNNIGSFGGDLRGIEWGENGDYIYLASQNNNTIFKYKTSRQYDVLGVENAFDINADTSEGTARAVELVDGGTKLYVAGNDTNSIHYFTLSNPYDVESASFESSFDTSTYTSDPSAIAVIDSGSTIVVGDRGNDELYEFDLNTNYDLSTASHNQTVSVSVDIDIWGLSIVNDGSKMFIADRNNQELIEYDLQTDYDVSSNLLVNNQNIGSQFGDVRGLTVSPDGSKVIIGNSNNNSLNQYEMTTPYDSTTLQYQSSHSVNNRVGSLSNVVGTNDAVFVLDSNNNDVRYYGTRTEYDISTASLEINPPRTIASFSSINITNSGSTLYITDTSDEKAYRFDLATDYDIQTAEQELDKFINVGNEGLNDLRAITVSDSGSTVLAGGNNSNNIKEYNLTTPYDLSSGTFTGNEINYSNDYSDITGMSFNSDGSSLYTVNGNDKKIRKYELSTNFDITTVSNITSSDDLNKNYLANEGSPNSVFVTPSGNKVVVCGYGYGDAHSFELETESDLSTITYSQVRSTMGTQSGSNKDHLQGIDVTNDGKRVIFGRTDNRRIVERVMENPHELSNSSRTYTYNEEAVTNYPIGNIRNLQWGEDGYNLIVTDNGSTTYRLSLTTPYHLSTASFPRRHLNSDNNTYQVSNPNDFQWADGGSKAYVLDNTYIYEMDASTDYDVNSLSMNGNRYNLNNRFNNPKAFTLVDSGTKLFVGSDDDSEEKIHEFTLSTPYNVSSATYNQNRNRGGFLLPKIERVEHVKFNDDYTKLFILGNEDDTVQPSNNLIYEFTLDSPFAIETAKLQERHNVSKYLSLEDNWFAPIKNLRSFEWANNGNKLYAADNDLVLQIPVNTPYDLTSVNEEGIESKPFNYDTEHISINDSEDKFYVLDQNRNSIIEFRFDTPGSMKSLQSSHRTNTTGSPLFVKDDYRILELFGYMRRKYNGDYTKGTKYFDQQYYSPLTGSGRIRVNRYLYDSGTKSFDGRYVRVHILPYSDRRQKVVGDYYRGDNNYPDTDRFKVGKNSEKIVQHTNKPGVREWDFKNSITDGINYQGATELNRRIDPNNIYDIEYDTERGHIHIAPQGRNAIISYDRRSADRIAGTRMVNRIKLDSNNYNLVSAQWVDDGNRIHVMTSNAEIIEFDLKKKYDLNSIRYEENMGQNRVSVDLQRDVTDSVNNIQSNYSARAFAWGDEGDILYVSDDQRNRVFVYTSTNFSLSDVSYLTSIDGLTRNPRDGGKELRDPTSMDMVDDGSSLLATESDMVSMVFENPSDRRGAEVTKEVEIDRSPDTAVVIDNSDESITTSYLIKDNEGNEVTVSSDKVNSVVDVSDIKAGEVSITQILDSQSVNVEGTVKSFSVFFN